MTKKEINELKKRFRPDRGAISKIYGCFVNTNREIISYLDTSLGQLTEEEAEMYLGRLKKVLSGTQGKNLIDVVFSTEQVAGSDEHSLLMALRESRLENGDVREEFYRKVIESLDPGESGYLILLACDSYDVPRKGKDGENGESETVFTYIVCAVCPVKGGREELKYYGEENEFHSSAGGLVAGPTALGLLFPAFDDRAANIYNALYYVQKSAELHQEFMDAIFHVEAPLSAEEQREAFHNALSQALDEELRYDVVQSLHEQLRERITDHRESKDPEPLRLSVAEVSGILRGCGVGEERLAAFSQACADHFGENAMLDGGNLIDESRFEIVTPDARVFLDPETSYLVESRVIDGRKYLLIPADQSVEINGMEVRIRNEAAGEAEAETDAETDASPAEPEAEAPEETEAAPEAAE